MHASLLCPLSESTKARITKDMDEIEQLMKYVLDAAEINVQAIQPAMDALKAFRFVCIASGSITFYFTVAH